MGVCRVVVGFIVLVASSHVFADDYEIRMSRPAKVGDAYELVASASSSEQVTFSTQGRLMGADKSFIAAKLECTVTVLQVDELDREKKVKLLVSKATMSTSKDGEQKEALPKGTQVVAQPGDGQEEYLIDGRVVPDEIAEMLGLFITFPTSQVTDDDVFGTKDRKRVGDSWAVNSIKAANDLAAEGLKVDPEDFEGSTTIEKAVVVDGIPCLTLSSKMELSKVEPPLPPEMTLEKSSMSAAYSGNFPVDTSLRRLSEKTNMTMEIVAKGEFAPNAPVVTMSVSAKHTTEVKQRPLK